MRDDSYTNCLVVPWKVDLPERLGYTFEADRDNYSVFVNREMPFNICKRMKIHKDLIAGDSSMALLYIKGGKGGSEIYILLRPQSAKMFRNGGDFLLKSLGETQRKELINKIISLAS